LLAPGHDEVDQALERRLLVGGRGCPKRLVALLAAVRPADPEQVDEAAVADVRVALEVEVEVAVGRLGQEAEAPAGLVGEQLVALLPGLALAQLERRLAAQL